MAQAKNLFLEMRLESGASRLIASVLLCLTVLAAGPSPAPIVIRVGLVANDDAATPLLYAQSAGLFAKVGLSSV